MGSMRYPAHKAALAGAITTLLGGCSNPPASTGPAPDANTKREATVAAPAPAPAPTIDKPRQLRVFLPDKAGKLRETVITEPDNLARQKLWQPECALRLLFNQAPGIIPPGTHLADRIRKNMNSPTGTVFE